MIDKITLRAGSHAEAEPLTFNAGPITVIVGPNYSGKSKLIREVQWHLQHGRPADDNVVLKDLTLKNISVDDADRMIDSIKQRPHLGETVQPDHIVVGKLGSRTQVKRDQLRDALTSFNGVPHNHHFRQWAGSWFFSHTTKLLDGQSRISLTNDQPFGDLISPSASTFQHLFRDDDLREEIRRIIHDAFGLYLVVDPTNPGTLRLRLSSRRPEDLTEEQSLTQRAAQFHAASTLLSQASDGTRAFCGILIEIMVGKPDLLLLDEPEAFLHPTLSYKLGKEMARQVQGQGKNLIISTHSPNFLMGCVTSGVPVNVVRLTYKGGVPTARLLPSEELSSLMRNPLLRSAGILSSLFYESVVITEGDTDRAFYQEVNDRLVAADDERRISNALFVNANGKDAIPVIMDPLRRLGIPAAGIYDLDFVKDGGNPSAKRLKSALIPDALSPGLSASRSIIKSELESLSCDYKRNGGIRNLSAEHQIAVNQYLMQLAFFGIFLVPVGEVEGWLKDFGITGHAANWLIPIFDAMGDEGSEAYVAPAEGDVWDFIGSISAWLSNPARLGV